MTVRDIRQLLTQTIVVMIYPLGLYGTGRVYYKGRAADIPETLYDEDVLSIMPLSRFEQGISIEFDENLLNKLNKEDEQ